MSNTYIDATRLLSWQGNYTGMERFAFEISKELEAKAKSNIKFCCFIPAKGFVALEDLYKIRPTKMTSPVIGSGPSLRQLVKNNKKSFLYHYVKRQKQKLKQKKLAPIKPTKDDNLLIYDGLWDRQDYIDAVIAQADSGTRLVHGICDVIPLVMPEVVLSFVTDAMRNYLDQVIPHIDVLMSISKNTQKDVEKLYGSKFKPNIEKIVLRFGDNISQRDKTSEPQQLNLKTGNYLLCVGTIEVRKNHKLLYEAYRLAAQQNLDLPKLVIVGREGWLAEETVNKLKTNPLVKDKIVFAGPINDQELAWLYVNCKFTVFPSLYEGWGLPVAESLYYGKVCAASSASSIPEIGSKLNAYYSPTNPEDCLKVIKRLLDDKYRAKLETDIKKNYKATLWSQTAADIIGVLKA